jgi:transketolase N-terminal domain/subunit
MFSFPGTSRYEKVSRNQYLNRVTRQGLSSGVGMAIAGKRDKKEYRVFFILM